MKKRDGIEVHTYSKISLFGLLEMVSDEWNA